MTKRDISMATPLKFCALVVGLGLVSSLAAPAQSASAQSSSELIRCSSSSRQATIACCERRYGNHPPVQQGHRKRTCAQAVICKISLLPLTKVAFPQRCSIDPLLKGNDKGKGFKL
jgi:hypothetical protein